MKHNIVKLLSGTNTTLKKDERTIKMKIEETLTREEQEKLSDFKNVTKRFEKT